MFKYNHVVEDDIPQFHDSFPSSVESYQERRQQTFMSSPSCYFQALWLVDYDVLVQGLSQAPWLVNYDAFVWPSLYKDPRPWSLSHYFSIDPLWYLSVYIYDLSPIYSYIYTLVVILSSAAFFVDSRLSESTIQMKKTTLLNPLHVFSPY